MSEYLLIMIPSEFYIGTMFFLIRRSSTRATSDQKKQKKKKNENVAMHCGS